MEEIIRLGRRNMQLYNREHIRKGTAGKLPARDAEAGKLFQLRIDLALCLLHPNIFLKYKAAKGQQIPFVGDEPLTQVTHCPFEGFQVAQA